MILLVLQTQMQIVHNKVRRSLKWETLETLVQLHHPCSFPTQRNETQGLQTYARGASVDPLFFLAEADERKEGSDAMKKHQNSGNSDK